VARGTARSIGQLSPYVGGKTGTSDDENDAWFVGFTNDVTIGVWVGYDNKGKRRTLGGGQTGGRVAVPIFEQIVQATWSMYASRRRSLRRPPEAKKELVASPIDLASGSRITDRRPQAFTEWFRVRHGEIADTQYNMVSQYEVAAPEENYSAGGYADNNGGFPYGGGRSYYGSGGGNPSRASSACSPRSRTTRRRNGRPTRRLPGSSNSTQRLHVSWSAALVITLSVVTSAKGLIAHEDAFLCRCDRGGFCSIYGGCRRDAAAGRSLAACILGRAACRRAPSLSPITARTSSSTPSPG